MAVSGSDITALRREQDELRRLIDSKSAEMESVRRSIQAENEARLQDLRAQANDAMKRRDERVREDYQRLLNKSGSEMQNRLYREMLEYQQRYDQVCAQVRAALSEEQRRNEELLVKQKQFERAYFEHMRFARDEALAVQKEVGALIRSIAENVPVEWFYPGRISFYRDQMFSIDRLIESGLFEGAVGYGGGLVRDLKLTAADAEDSFHKWFHYYTILHGVLADEKQLLFNTSRKVPEEYKVFCMAEGVTDNTLTPEKLDYWSDGRYSEMLKEYEQVNMDIQQFFVDGKALSGEEEVRQFMIKNPELSARLQENVLYSAGRDGINRMEKITRTIRRCYDRIGAFNERLLLALQLKKSLSSIGSSKIPPASEPGAPIVLYFTDDMNINTAEIIITPVLRRSDDKWLNMAACFVSEGMNSDSVDELRPLIAEVLVTKGINVDKYIKMKPGQTTSERIGIVSTDMQMKVNGRLN
ncbi:MAG: hypothetical protein IIZ18_02195 [Ruminococcus sp.]|nr:hypothetical protein [Ruminococcus sp.]